MPDDELFGISVMKQVDDYYSYRIDFAADSFVVPGSDVNGWRIYRIPVKSALAAETTFAEPGIAPKWDNSGMMHMRAWVASDGGGDETIDTVLIARWYVE